MDEPSDASDAQVEPPFQFSLRAMLVLQLVCAAFLALLLAINVFAVLMALVATLIAAAVPVRPQHERLKRMGIDLMGGLVLPTLCIIYDPGIREFPLAYPALGIQMFALTVWLLVGPTWRWFSAFVAGVLMVGTPIAVIIGIALIPLSLMGLLFRGLGLLGFTPFLTASIFGRTMNKAIQHTAGLRSRELVVLLGVLAAIIIPALVHFTWGEALNQFVHNLPQPRSVLSSF